MEQKNYAVGEQKVGQPRRPTSCVLSRPPTLPHALVAPIQAVTMAMSVTIGSGYVIACSYFKVQISLLDVWIGLVLMQGSRAITFSFRHWFDRRGPLALKLALAKESEDSEEKEGEGVKNNGEDA